MSISTPHSYLFSQILCGKAGSTQKTCAAYPKKSSATFAGTRMQLESQTSRVISEIAWLQQLTSGLPVTRAQSRQACW
jgi:hypothetical protein